MRRRVVFPTSASSVRRRPWQLGHTCARIPARAGREGANGSAAGHCPRSSQQPGPLLQPASQSPGGERSRHVPRSPCKTRRTSRLTTAYVLPLARPTRAAAPTGDDGTPVLTPDQRCAPDDTGRGERHILGSAVVTLPPEADDSFYERGKSCRTARKVGRFAANTFRKEKKKKRTTYARLSNLGARGDAVCVDSVHFLRS